LVLQIRRDDLRFLTKLCGFRVKQRFAGSLFASVGQSARTLAHSKAPLRLLTTPAAMTAPGSQLTSSMYPDLPKGAPVEVAGCNFQRSPVIAKQAALLSEYRYVPYNSTSAMR
jgi:hypothetical protein